MGLNKKQYINSTRNIINKLGELPLIFEGSIDSITEIIDELKSKHEKLQSITSHKRVLSNTTASSIFGVNNDRLYTI